MPASGAVDGGLCAVGAGGEVERGVGRYSSAIYGKEKDMRPKRYPYQGMKKESIAVTIEPKLKTRLLCDSSLVERLVIKNKNSEITFSGTKVEIKAQSITGV